MLSLLSNLERLVDKCVFDKELDDIAACNNRYMRGAFPEIYTKEELEREKRKDERLTVRLAKKGDKLKSLEEQGQKSSKMFHNRFLQLTSKSHNDLSYREMPNDLTYDARHGSRSDYFYHMEGDGSVDDSMTVRSASMPSWEHSYGWDSSQLTYLHAETAGSSSDYVEGGSDEYHYSRSNAYWDTQEPCSSDRAHYRERRRAASTSSVETSSSPCYLVNKGNSTGWEHDESSSSEDYSRTANRKEVAEKGSKRQRSGSQREKTEAGPEHQEVEDIQFVNIHHSFTDLDLDILEYLN